MSPPISPIKWKGEGRWRGPFAPHSIGYLSLTLISSLMFGYKTNILLFLHKIHRRELKHNRMQDRDPRAKAETTPSNSSLVAESTSVCRSKTIYYYHSAVGHCRMDGV